MALVSLVVGLVIRCSVPNDAAEEPEPEPEPRRRVSIFTRGVSAFSTSVLHREVQTREEMTTAALLDSAALAIDRVSLGGSE